MTEPETAMACRCLIYHPQTEKERRAVAENLRYSRSIGDNLGVILALAQLQGCPEKKTS